MSTNQYGIIFSRADGNLLCKLEVGNSHDPQAIAINDCKRWSMVAISKLQVVGQVPKKYLPISFFDILVRLYRYVKFWMVKI